MISEGSVCKACAAKMHALESVESQSIPIRSEMAGHPSLAPYIEDSYRIATF